MGSAKFGEPGDRNQPVSRAVTADWSSMWRGEAEPIGVGIARRTPPPRGRPGTLKPRRSPITGGRPLGARCAQWQGRRGLLLLGDTARRERDHAVLGHPQPAALRHGHPTSTQNPAFAELARTVTPAKRGGRPEELAAAAPGLSADAASYLFGHISSSMAA